MTSASPGAVLAVKQWQRQLPAGSHLFAQDVDLNHIWGAMHVVHHLNKFSTTATRQDRLGNLLHPGLSPHPHLIRPYRQLGPIILNKTQHPPFQKLFYMVDVVCDVTVINYDILNDMSKAWQAVKGFSHLSIIVLGYWGNAVGSRRYLYLPKGWMWSVLGCLYPRGIDDSYPLSASRIVRI